MSIIPCDDCGIALNAAFAPHVPFPPLLALLGEILWLMLHLLPLRQEILLRFGPLSKLKLVSKLPAKIEYLLDWKKKRRTHS